MISNMNDFSLTNEVYGEEKVVLLKTGSGLNPNVA